MLGNKMDLANKVDISLNQNLWTFIVSLLSLGAAEYFELPKLIWFSNIMCWVSCCSVIFTTIAYTYVYIKNKLIRQKEK